MRIFQATSKDVARISLLFNDYRVFYKQESDVQAATVFLEERLLKNESIIFYAEEGNMVLGFTQLYFSFSSVSLKPTLILNDLFVDSSYRRKGIGEALLNKTKEFCITNNYKGLALETAIDNPAQQLYEKLDWKKDAQCFHYFWSANS